jgi:hypothetical protein
MKRCPTCNQTFAEDWLGFCTQDGTALVDDRGATSEPLSTIVSPPPVATPVDQAVRSLPSTEPVGGPQVPAPQPGPPAWKPPPPPSYIQPQNKGMATASMIIGIASMACLGPIPGIVAIVLGAMTLSQIKKNPDTVAGKQQAMTGIITGSLAILIYGVGFIIYILFVIAMANQ